MKHAKTLFSLGILSLSLTLSACPQEGVQKPTAPSPDPNALAPAAGQTAAQVPGQPGQQPGDQPGTPAGAAAGTPADPTPVMDLDPNYILGVDDAIMVHVWKEPTISGPLLIRPDGRISLPLVGDLSASGMTPMALAAEISDNLKKFINDPSVTVTVTATNSRRVFFVGEILHSGPLLISRNMTVLQAISAAGGLSPYANKHKIYILRGEKGKEKKIPFDYSKALKQGNEQGVSLIPGDTIVVP
jgi:polysaccharide export outer membrane protein